MKKILLIAVLFLSLSLASAENMTVSLSDATGAKGGIAKVDLILKGASAVGSMDVIIKYDNNILQAVFVEADGLGKNSFLEANTANKGEVRIALVDPSGINGDGKVAIINFAVIGDIGSKSDLSIDKIVLNDINLSKLEAITMDGSLIVDKEIKTSGGVANVILGMIAMILALLFMRKKRRHW